MKREIQKHENGMVEKITGDDYYVMPSGWTIAGASRENVYFNTHTGYHYPDVPDLLEFQRPLIVELRNGKVQTFPVLE